MMEKHLQAQSGVTAAGTVSVSSESGKDPGGFHEDGGHGICLWGVYLGGKAAETFQHGNVGP